MEMRMNGAYPTCPKHLITMTVYANTNEKFQYRCAACVEEQRLEQSREIENGKIHTN